MLFDDDNCDCYLFFNFGYGMCNDGYFISYSKVNVFGVDVLFDNGCYGLV